MNIAKKVTELHLKRFFTNVTFIRILILIPEYKELNAPHVPKC